MPLSSALSGLTRSITLKSLSATGQNRRTNRGGTLLGTSCLHKWDIGISSSANILLYGTPYVLSVKLSPIEAVQSGFVATHILCNNSLNRIMIDWINAALATLAASINVNNPGGLAAIFFIAASCDIGIPFPFVLDTIVFFTTYEVGALSWPVLLVLLTLLSGSLLGTSILYWVSRLLGTRFVNWLGRRSKVLRRSLEQFQNRLGRWTVPAIVAARLTPGSMQVSSVVAGTVRIRYHRMVLAILFSFIIYDGILIILGTLARLGFKDVGPQYSFWIVLGFLATMAVVFLAIHLIRHRSDRANRATN
jgi:membrane protein DedA with SNARE-associated domain